MTAQLTGQLVGMSAVQAVLWVAGAVVTMAGFTGVLWWLVWPRIEDKLQELVGKVDTMQGQLVDDAPDTIGRHARVAASAAAELPAIRDELVQLANAQAATDQWRQLWEIRLGSVEQALVALLGPELRRRLFADLQDEHHERRTTT